MLKRLIDIVVSSSILFASLPLMMGIALLVRVFLGRPVIFRQKRPGRMEKPFVLYKFRTMTTDCNAGGELLADGSRLTAVGELLRSTSLDELPTLLNVLKGEMSLVGPRPLLTKYLPYFTDRERVRHSIRPGITGWAQVHGRNELSWDRRLALDVEYVENRSLLLDVRILIRTALVVFRRSGVIVDARSIMLNLDEERTSVTGQVE